MSVYADRICSAKDYETLCQIVEEACDNLNISEEDYCMVCAACERKARAMGL